MSVMDKYADDITLVNVRLQKLLTDIYTNEKLQEAMMYSVQAGGKRMRPMLNIMGNALLDGNKQETLDIACAIEMIHTYSLIHDDLPAMDNDELRRGMPTSHVKFGEAYAILAGDGLLNFAFETMMHNAQRFPGNIKAHVDAMTEVARSAGAFGMIAGQCADIENEGKELTEQDLNYLYRYKTGALIKAALLSGLLLCDPGHRQMRAVSIYGTNIGLAFQVVDDVLDVTADAATIGKTPGKDKKAGKFTFVDLYGVEGSRRIAREKTEEAIAALGVFGDKAADLIAFASDMLGREH